MVIRYIPQYADDSDQVVTQELDYATFYRRPEIEPKVVVQEPLRDDILFRLWLARQMALMRAEGHRLLITQT